MRKNHQAPRSIFDGPARRYAALLLMAIRDGQVSDWKTLLEFQTRNGLALVTWGTQSVGQPPSVAALLRNIESANLIELDGDDIDRTVWVRKDNERQSPDAKFVYDPHDLDPDHELSSPKALKTLNIRMTLSPWWYKMQDALGISLKSLAAMQDSRAVIVTPEVFPEQRRKQNYADVFVLMPFRDDMRPIFVDHIAPVCKRQHFSVARADDFFTAHEVMADVWGAIKNAKIIIADCTSRNPNVFYEMGISHVLGKSVIILSQKEKDVPFDIRHIRYIRYVYTPPGMKKLEVALEKTLASLMDQ